MILSVGEQTPESKVEVVEETMTNEKSEKHRYRNEIRNEIRNQGHAQCHIELGNVPRRSPLCVGKVKNSTARVKLYGKIKQVNDEP